MDYRECARARQDQLTKPPGSLGRLEELAVQLAGIQRSERPDARPAAAVLFASDHPVTAHGVSAYPSSVTAAMMANFAAGRAASTVFAADLGVPLEVVDVGVGSPYPSGLTLRREEVASAQAGDLRTEDAMTPEVFGAALAAGAAAVDRLAGVRVLILGEMGIGNTTPASAVASALLGLPPEQIVGAGTGVQGEALERKRQVVADALARGVDRRDPREALRTLGGREIAALAGAALRARERGIAVLVDGFIVSAAVLAAARIEPGLAEHLIFAHRSAEPGHDAILNALSAAPLLDLRLRLGEGSGALCALPLLDLACSMHNRMATFEEAGIEGPV
ncbi:MAG: nicotinate-nucleotide--dimethylbenzimidazole phosphoribosyltransferase [Planctomycetota bacterium]